jgi:hypothetical protein
LVSGAATRYQLKKHIYHTTSAFSFLAEPELASPPEVEREAAIPRLAYCITTIKGKAAEAALSRRDDCCHTMDLLHAAGYESSSPSSSIISAQSCPKNHDPLLKSNGQNALDRHAPDNSPCLGHNDHSSPGEAHGNAAKKRDSFHSPRPAVAKKQKNLTQKVTIASCYNDAACLTSDQYFERSNPHWEGRWAGHIYLPFPNIESLDLCDNDGTGENILDDSSDSESDKSSSGSVSSIEEEGFKSSRRFLPTARILIHYWAALLNESFNDDDDDTSSMNIVPHLSMSPKNSRHKSIQNSSNQFNQNNSPSLHISLSRPMYLPGPSVDSFLVDISSSISAVLSVARRHGHSNSQEGRTIHLRPHNATIFTNDNQTRSFLAVPISEESSRWAKRVLLPPIDSAMLRFGQKTYYTEGEGCILHVSIASVKGNMIPKILRNRSKGITSRRKGDSTQSAAENESKLRSIPLFQKQGCDPLKDETLNSIPKSIPIRLEHIQCDFGRVKNILLSL